MAEELQRAFDDRARRIDISIADDLGVTHVIQGHAGLERCPMCQREMPVDGAGKIDLDKLVQEVCASLDAETDAVISVFEKHGRDMTAVKQRISESRNQASASGGNPAPTGGNPTG